MLKKLALLGCSLLLTGVSYAETLTTTASPPAIFNQTIAFNTASFDSVVITGDAKLLLNSQTTQHPTLQLQGETLAVKAIKPSISNHTLYLDFAGISSNNLIQVNLNCGVLKRLSYSGNNNGNLSGTISSDGLSLLLQNLQSVSLSGKNIALQQLSLEHISNVQLNNLNTPNLMANIHDVNETNLEGMIGLSQLNQTGQGRFSAMWINSSKLTIQADNRANIYLAGKVDFLNATMQQYSQLHAQYLHSEKAFIHTEGHSHAYTGVTDALNAYAADSSSIYYYSNPSYLSRYTKEKGVVLLMQKRPLFCMHAICKQLPAIPG